jgi:hypothetical protein
LDNDGEEETTAEEGEAITHEADVASRSTGINDEQQLAGDQRKESQDLPEDCAVDQTSTKSRDGNQGT